MENTKRKQITYINGARLQRALTAGINNVIARQDHLNKINVFPVADKDTGTNMAMTLDAIKQATNDTKLENIHELMNTVADSALEGARGNSGAILAQFFQGFQAGLVSPTAKMTTENFAFAFEEGVKQARLALSDPKEGTILSVLSSFSLHLKQSIQKGSSDFIALLQHGMAGAEESLSKTPDQLKCLKKAGVVDAGAQGFVDFIHGVYDYIKTGKVNELYFKIANTEPDHNHKMNHENCKLTYRYCTECLITGENINRSELRDTLKKVGDSLIVAGSIHKAKIHIHCNNPGEIFDICRTYGIIKSEKADDMQQQQNTTHNIQQKVAILVDSTADIPENIIEKLHIHVVPLTVQFDSECYLDKVSISTEDFYKKLATCKTLAKTSQPNQATFQRQYHYLTSHYESVIAIHIPRGMSGTIVSSERAAASLTNADISVIDSMTTGNGHALIAIKAAEMAQANCPKSEILEEIKRLAEKTQYYAAIPDLTQAVKGGRVAKSKRTLANLLHITALITIKEDGKPAPGGAMFGKKHTPKKLAKYVLKRMDPKKSYRVSISHTNFLSGAIEVKERLTRVSTNLEDVFITDSSATLAVHVGPGVIAIAIQEYEDIREPAMPLSLV